MKSSVCVLLLVLASTGLFAQSPHLVTIAELKQLANCPEYTCLGSMVNAWGYNYKGLKKGEINGLAGTQYRYVRPHPNPMFAEFTASYWLLNDNSQRVTLTSDNKDWSAGLTRDIGQNGFTVASEKSTLSSEDTYYVLTENGVVWHLIWQQPSLFTGTAPHTLTIYHDLVTNSAVLAAAGSDTGTSPDRTATPAAQPAVTNPALDDLPHLGGNWDAKYPAYDAAGLFKAERQYAADYERTHGKTGNTFSRCEKVRIQAKLMGQYRPLTDKRWDEAFDPALRHTGFDAFANERTELYKQEVLFRTAGELVWIPIQEIWAGLLQKEAKVGESITLYAVLVSHHDFGGTLHLSFLANEFAAAATTDSFDSKPVSALTTTHADEPTPSQATAVPSKSQTKPCGFNWIPWNSVSTTEKSAMRKVLVMGDDGPNVGLLPYIANELTQGNKIQIARHDFFNDGQPGYVVYIEYKTLQYGDKGRVEVFDNLGESKLWPPASVKTNLCAVRPVDDTSQQPRRRGVLGDDNQLREFLGSLFFDRAYARFMQQTKQVASTTADSRVSQPEEFKAFIQRFSTDKVFQLSRVKFPLTSKSSGNDEGDLISRRYSATTWQHLDLTKPSDPIYRRGLNPPIKVKPASASVWETCKLGDCGYSLTHSFQRVDGRWFLIAIRSYDG